MKPLQNAAGILALVGGIFSPSSALASDAVADFSHTQNPIGVWRYGYETNLTFQLMPTNAVQVHTNVWFWQGRPGQPPLGEPTVGKNEGTNSWVINGTTTYTPGMFALHPGSTNQLAVLRWTAPSNGTYAIIASFQGADASTTSDAHIAVANTEVWSDLVAGSTTPTGYSFYATVTSGQTIDFKVGYGSNHNYTNDTTITKVTINPASTCWDAGENFSYTSNPNGAWTYGYDDGTGFAVIESDGAGLVHEDPDVYFWQGGPGFIGEPTVGKNVGNSAWVIADSTTYEAGDFGLHPGPSGERSVVRWTCPSSGTYHVFASFTAGDPNNTSDAQIIKAGSTTLLALGNIPQTYDANVSLTTGQTLDFSAGWGPNDDYLFDTTITVITICPVP